MIAVLGRQNLFTESTLTAVLPAFVRSDIATTLTLARFTHVIAGSVEAFYAVFSGDASFGDYLRSFLAPTIIGNTIGGVALVALLNHAPLAPELRE